MKNMRGLSTGPRTLFTLLAILTLILVYKAKILHKAQCCLSQCSFEYGTHIEDTCSIHARFQRTQETRLEGVMDCVVDGMTFFTREKLEERAKVLHSLSEVDGAFVEAGVALGGTAILATHVAKNRPVHLYDVFGMIPPPDHTKDTDDAKERYNTIRSGKSRGFGNSTYYGYMSDVIGQVKTNYQTCKVSTDCVQFHKGLVEDTMKNIDFDIAYLHCDTDFYSAVFHCLVDGEPHVTVAGIITIDDYFSYGSAQKAYEDYFTYLNDTHVQTSRNHVYYKTMTDIVTLRRVL